MAHLRPQHTTSRPCPFFKLHRTPENPPFQSRPTPPLPGAFPESAAARGRQMEENENERNKRPSSPPPPLPNGIIPLRRQASIHDLDETASSSDVETTGLITAENPFVSMEPNHHREKLCIKAAEMVWNDLSQVLIWSMRDIDWNDEAMCERVTDLLGPDLRGEEVVLGDPFMTPNFDGIQVLEDRRLCGILVASDKARPAKVRVADLKNLKPQTEKYPIGYDEFDVATGKYYGSHVMIVKRGQQAVIEGRVKLRLFVRVVLGTDARSARVAAEDAWNFRSSLYDVSGDLWHEYFTGGLE